MNYTNTCKYQTERYDCYPLPIKCSHICLHKRIKYNRYSHIDKNAANLSPFKSKGIKKAIKHKWNHKIPNQRFRNSKVLQKPLCLPRKRCKQKIGHPCWQKCYCLFRRRNFYIFSINRIAGGTTLSYLINLN